MTDRNKLSTMQKDRQAPRETTSSDLLRGGRELCIIHKGERYSLRVTSNDRLILTK